MNIQMRPILKDLYNVNATEFCKWFLFDNQAKINQLINTRKQEPKATFQASWTLAVYQLQ